jgi:hypothetical protein
MAKKKSESHLENFRKKISDIKKEIRKRTLDFPDFFESEKYGDTEENPFEVLEATLNHLKYFTEINSNYEKYLIRGNIKMKSISNDIGSRRSQKAVIDIICTFIENSKFDHDQAKKEFDTKLKQLAETYPKIKNDDVVDEITKYISAADFIWSGKYEQL